MRFALLGEHPDGVDLAAALVASKRHTVVAVTTRLDDGASARLGQPGHVTDVEEVLADPAVEAVIVAGGPAVRAAQLRRALQSERHVLCVHPAGDRADTAHEAALLQGDTGKLLLPILPETLHPAVGRMAALVGRSGDTAAALGELQLLLVRRESTGEVLDVGGDEAALAVPGWDLLRRIGGEVAEVSAVADGEELTTGRPALLAGRFDRGGLFQVTLLPLRPHRRWAITVVGSRGEAELLWPDGWDGETVLRWTADGEAREDRWPPCDPWPAVVAAFESAVGGEPAPLTWDDEIRALELDDAARRSVERRRVNVMEYPEASEAVGFKGTMALAGCGLLWLVLLLLVASCWVPQLGWLILPLLLAFIAVQLFRPAPPVDRPPS